MSVDEALVVLEQALQPQRLSDLQQMVFCRSWLGQGYEEIAAELAYGDGYIREIGSQLWLALSQAIGQKVTKKNLHAALRRYQQEQHPLGTQLQFGGYSQAIDSHSDSSPDALEFPSGAVPLNSRFYVDRPPIEAQVFREIGKPGSLIRIRAPRQMGKSSLMHRLIAHAKQEGLQTASLNLQRADRAIFDSLDQFLRWLCANVSQQLGLTPTMDEYWNADTGSKMSCTLYFQCYLLKSIDRAFVLAIDEVNRIFEYPELAADFLPLLRSWYEDASEFEVWQKLRLVIVHSTEVYIPLNLNQSPFNVGLPIKLPELTLAQIQDLALRHHLHWAEGEAGTRQLQPLLDLIGGHPYLVRLALYGLGQQEITLEQLLAEAPTLAGIYGEHLRHQLSLLQKDSTLAIALKRVLSDELIHLEPVTAYKLESLGLIKLQGDRVIPSRKLYQIYFQNELLSTG
ncbi:MAG: hypothetical protein HC895_20980 [Leptolyngbyaceae cyanobacterium SM1_3_5]|nr:hypothetical protein [Leptolyngbyaceae cyanobacterium SM1_3_5]